MEHGGEGGGVCDGKVVAAMGHGGDGLLGEHSISGECGHWLLEFSKAGSCGGEFGEGVALGCESSLSLIHI